MTEQQTDMTTADAAAELGVHRKTVLGYIEREGLPAYRLGRRLRIERKKFDHWKAARSTRPMPPATDDAKPTDTTSATPANPPSR